jgi:hypothetical protein
MASPILHMVFVILHHLGILFAHPTVKSEHLVLVDVGGLAVTGEVGQVVVSFRSRQKGDHVVQTAQRTGRRSESIFNLSLDISG